MNKLRLLFIVLAALFCLGIDAGDASANSAWKELRGHSACGGVDRNGNLQEACGFDKAKFESKAVGKCPAGSFFDIGTWSCYTCPNGFNRNARPVNSPKACDRPIQTSTMKATFLGKASCPAGAFIDGRNGGECWQCPAGYGRTAAAVDQWNACGMVGKKAVGALFKGKVCSAEGAFRDPRNGGECWKCPEDHARTAAAVTAGNACQTNLAFEPAVKQAALTCPAGQHFDFIDGGTCWSCPPDTTRSLFGVKTAKACRIKKMRWVVPERGKYSLFGLGQGADDILAKLIAERTQIDDAARAAAKVAGVSEAEAIAKTWKVIDANPWDSPILSALLGQIVMEAAVKPDAQRTASEKDLLTTIALLIQWNRQFIAYQSKQAFDTYLAAANRSNEIALSKMGAASVYAGGVVAPPDYNEIVGGAIQVTAGFAGPAGAVGITLLSKATKAALIPFSKAAKDAGKMGAALTVSGGNVAAASAAPLMLAAAVSVVVTMEMDKLMKMEVQEGKIRQAIDIANRPVDIGIMLQQKQGPDEFLFHWAAVIGGNTQPSANFKARLAAYQTGKVPGDLSSIDLSKITVISTTSTVNPTSSTPTIGEIKVDKIQSSTVVVNTPTATPSQPLQPASQQAAAVTSGLAEEIEKAVAAQKSQGPNGAARIELSNQPGACVTKAAGSALSMAMIDCRNSRALWITPNAATNSLVVADKYCIDAAASGAPAIAACAANLPGQKWQLTQTGNIRQIATGECLAAANDNRLVLQKCGTAPGLEIWRPWAGQ